MACSVDLGGVPARLNPVCCANLTNVLNPATDTTLKTDGCFCAHHMTGDDCTTSYVAYFGAWWDIRFALLAVVHLVLLVRCVRELRDISATKGIWRSRYNMQTIAFLIACSFLVLRVAYIFPSWFLWQEQPNHPARLILMQAGLSMLMTVYACVGMYWRKLVGKDAFDNAVGLPRRLNFFLTLYCLGYVTVTMSFRLIEVTTGNLTFKNLVGIINSFVILSIVLPFMYFGKKLLNALGALSSKNDKFDADKEAPKNKDVAKLRALTFRILKIGNVMILYLVTIIIFSATRSNFYPAQWWWQTTLHRLVELGLIKYAMDMLRPKKKGGKNGKVRPTTAVSHAAVTVAESDIGDKRKGFDGDVEELDLRSTNATSTPSTMAVSSSTAGSSTVVSAKGGSANSTGFTTAATSAATSSATSTAVGGGSADSGDVQSA